MSPRPNTTAQGRLPDCLDRPWAVPMLLFAASFLFRFHFVNAGLFHFDEVATAMAVEESARELRLAGEVNGRYGTVLLNLLAYLPWRFLGGASSEPVLLFVSVLSGALLSAAFYTFAREVAGSRCAAALSSLFLTFNFLFLTVSTTAKEQTTQLLFLVLSFHLLAKGAREGRGGITLLAAAAFSFSLTVHEGGAPLLPVFLAFLVLLERGHGAGAAAIAKKAAASLAIAAIPFALYLGAIVAARAGGAGETAIRFVGLYPPLLREAVGDLAVVSGPLLLLAVPGAFLLHRRKSPFLLPLLLWLALFFYFSGVSTYTSRYLAYLLPPLALAAGESVAFLLGRFPSPPARAGIAALAAAAVCGYGTAMAHPILAARSARCGPKESALFVRDRTPPDAVVLATDERLHIGYYGGRTAVAHPAHEAGPIREFLDDVERAVRSGGKVYLTTSGFHYDRYSHFANGLEERFVLLSVGETAGEDYHRGELALREYRAALYRLIPKGAPRVAP